MFTLLTILSLCLDSTMTICSPAIDDSLFYVWSNGEQTMATDEDWFNAVRAFAKTL